MGRSAHETRSLLGRTASEEEGKDAERDLGVDLPWKRSDGAVVHGVYSNTRHSGGLGRKLPGKDGRRNWCDET